MSKESHTNNTLHVIDDYNLLIDNISTLWIKAKEKAVVSVNTELL